ncbi:uncharacterized protein [Argopecten irradians]|uniref:uncharacterized protein n=1 Tax=Argopecten irradians TaxID=31199 RepID=UPI00371F2D0B
MYFDFEAVCLNINKIWEEDITEANLIYTNGVVFIKQLPNAIKCARACQRHYVPCLDYSYTTTTEECRGYDGLSHDFISQSDTQMWKKTCRLSGYTYDPAFRVCIRLYPIAQTWFQALEACYADAAHLLIVDTVDKVRATVTGLHKNIFAETHKWWLGGYDNENGTKWLNNENIDIPSAIWYHPAQPDCDSEQCINLYLHPLGINDQQCLDLMFYACQERK